jgi:hypothetical protein
LIIKDECSVELLRENEDGSADFAFNFPKEALDALTRLGILTAIQAGIEDAKRLNPDDPVNTSEERVEFTDEIKRIAEEAGFATWGIEKYRPDGAVVDWACEYDVELVKFYQLATDLAYKRAMRDAVGLLKTQHELVKERHNYYRHAANIIHLEFLEEDDD